MVWRSVLFPISKSYFNISFCVEFRCSPSATSLFCFSLKNIVLFCSGVMYVVCTKHIMIPGFQFSMNAHLCSYSSVQILFKTTSDNKSMLKLIITLINIVDNTCVHQLFVILTFLYLPSFVPFLCRTNLI